MSVNTRMRRRARKGWPWLALSLLLLPSLGGATPPVDAATADAPASDGVRRGHIKSGHVHIGRIFFSPAQRRQRYADKTPAANLSANSAPRDGRLQINGAVSSSTQGRAVWVNGSAIENSAQLKSAWTDRGGSVWLRDDRHLPRLVRPGQAMDPTSGAIEDLLPPKSVARH
jgi:hypothetical protein